MLHKKGIYVNPKTKKIWVFSPPKPRWTTSPLISKEGFTLILLRRHNEQQN